MPTSCGRRCAAGEITADEASLAARLLEHADVELMPMRCLLEPATRRAIARDHPTYDCLYLALAQSSGCSFVTADARFCAKLKGRASTDQVLDLVTARERLDAQAGQ